MQSPFIDNIWGADIHLISKFNKGFRFLFLTYVIRDLKDEEMERFTKTNLELEK